LNVVTLWEGSPFAAYQTPLTPPFTRQLESGVWDEDKVKLEL